MGRPMRSRADSGRSRSRGRRDLRKAVWRWGSRLTMTVGVLCSAARWGWATTLAEVLVFAFCAAFIAGAILASDGLNATLKVTRIALSTGFALPAVAGVVAVFGAAGVLLLLGLLAISPAVRFCVENRWFIAENAFAPAATTEPRRRDAAQAVEPVPAPQPASIVTYAALPRDLDILDDAALCLAWRRSFPMLEAARTEPERMALVDQRQLYLDEMQRRCPKGVAAWLASGARASSNPMPFLRDGSPRPGTSS
jgi:hypothetical protein